MDSKSENFMTFIDRLGMTQLSLNLRTKTTATTTYQVGVILYDYNFSRIDKIFGGP